MKAYLAVAGVVLACLGSTVLETAAACNTAGGGGINWSSQAVGLDAWRFVDAVTQGMANHFKGYAVILVDQHGEEIASIAKGLARTSCDEDGLAYFTGDTKTPWGSVSKIVTTAAALRAVQESHVIHLESKFKDVLPYRWRLILNQDDPRDPNDAGYEDVTIAMLLQHKGGFPNSSSTRGLLQAEPLDVGTRRYSNKNMTFFSYMFGYMIDPIYMHSLESSLIRRPHDVYDQAVKSVNSILYRDYVNNAVFSQAGAVGTCNMADYVGTHSNYTLWFDSPSDPRGTLSPDGTQGCASGSWILSAREMSRFLHTLKFTELIVSHETYARMESADPLGWWRLSHQYGPSYAHNGLWGSTRSQVIAFRSGHIAVAVVNSPPPQAICTEDDTVCIGAILVDAYDQARTQGIAQLSAHIVPIVADGLLDWQAPGEGNPKKLTFESYPRH